MARPLIKGLTLAMIADKIIAYGRAGKSIRLLSRDLNVGERTVWSWKEKYPTIEDAFELHHTFFSAFYEDLIHKHITGEAPLTKEQHVLCQQMLYVYDKTWKESKNTKFEKKAEDSTDTLDAAEVDAALNQLLKGDKDE